jgi:hypothetical protein
MSDCYSEEVYESKLAIERLGCGKYLAPIERKLIALEAERNALRACLEIYADPMNWCCTEFGEYHEHGDTCCKDGWWNRSDAHGYSPAQECLAKLEKH